MGVATFFNSRIGTLGAFTVKYSISLWRKARTRTSSCTGPCSDEMKLTTTTHSSCKVVLAVVVGGGTAVVMVSGSR